MFCVYWDIRTSNIRSNEEDLCKENIVKFQPYLFTLPTFSWLWPSCQLTGSPQLLQKFTQFFQTTYHLVQPTCFSHNNRTIQSLLLRQTKNFTPQEKNKTRIYFQEHNNLKRCKKTRWGCSPRAENWSILRRTSPAPVRCRVNVDDVGPASRRRQAVDTCWQIACSCSVSSEAKTGSPIAWITRRKGARFFAADFFKICFSIQEKHGDSLFNCIRPYFTGW